MEIREAINEVFIEGILKEKNLELATIDTENGKAEVIRGDLVITTSENSEHRVRIFANKYTKENKENSVYKGLVTVMNDYISIAEALKNGQTEENADKVRIKRGKLGLNEFYTPNGELRSFPIVTTNFINRVDKNFDPKAEFSIEAYFVSFKPEMKNDEETGRLVINTIIPLYGGKVIPLTFIAEDEDVVDYLQTNYEVNKTGKVWGELINTVDVTRIEEKGFGKSKEKIITKTINELIITGGEEDMYDEDDEKSYSTDLIKKAMAERDIYLDELLKKSKKDNNSSNKSKNTAKKELNF
jgi:hypothetical protein